MKNGPSSRSLKTAGWEEEIEGIMGAKLDNVSNARMDFARSGVSAVGKLESGQPPQSGTCLISLMSVEQERAVGGCIATVSRSQIDTQAIKTHKKESGSRAAMSLFVGSRAINNSGAL